MTFTIIIVGFLLITLNYFFLRSINPLMLSLVFWFFALFFSSLNLMDIDKVEWHTYSLLLILMTLSQVGGIIAFQTNKSSYRDDSIIWFDKYPYAIFLISALAISFNFFSVLKYIGGFVGFISSGNILYHDRIEGTFRVPVPYLSSFIYFSCVYFGREIARKKDIRSVIFAILTLLFTVVDSLSSFGRLNFIIGFLLVFLSYFYSNNKKNNFKISIGKAKQVFFSVLGVGILIYLLVLVRDTRGGSEDYHFKKDTPIFLKKLDELGLFRPSLYFYFVSPVAVFDNTFSHRFKNKTPLGYETFAPILRPILKFSGEENISYYDEFINIGEREANIGTVYKNIYTDFGFTGLFFFSLLFGLVGIYIYCKWQTSENFHYLNVFFSLALIMGIIQNFFSLGQFIFPFVLIIVSQIFLKFKWKFLL